MPLWLFIRLLILHQMIKAGNAGAIVEFGPATFALTLPPASAKRPRGSALRQDGLKEELSARANLWTDAPAHSDGLCAALTRRLLHVFSRDPTVRAGTGDRRNIDFPINRQPNHNRRRTNARPHGLVWH